MTDKAIIKQILLTKLAEANTIRRNCGTKQAGAYSDAILSEIPRNALALTPLSPIYGLGSLGGYGAGLVGPTPSLTEISKMDATPARSLIPAIGPMRSIMRRKALRNILKDRTSKSDISVPISESLGSSTGTAIGTTLGALAGYGASGFVSKDPNDRALVTLLGGAAGLASSTLLPGLIALLRKRRTLEQQRTYENNAGTIAKNYLIPGYGTYNQFKSLGASSHLSNLDNNVENKKYIEKLMADKKNTSK
ncbi:MAG: hypothetical protein Q4D38_00190 [Planctomycetia bacterium]|nr:hypothetical protein [Planctomycetia bacterium]